MIEHFMKTNLNLGDVAVSLNIWKRCSEFPRSLIPTADDVRSSRNQLCHDLFECDESLKTEVFTNIKNLIHQNDLYVPDIGALLGCIRDLENDQLNGYKQEVECIVNGLKHLNGRLTHVETQVSMLSKYFYAVMFFICLVTVLTYCSRNTLSPTLTMPWMRSSEIGDCVTENIYGDFSIPLKLEAYLKHHKQLFGREWLFDLIDNSIQTMNSSTRGLVLEADMGYGKSAFVAHTVCADEHSKGYRLRKMIIAYHVCIYDVLLTQKPGLFVRRLISMISNFVPEFMSQLLTDRQCFEHYNGEYCNEDYLGCIDMCIIHPLQELSRTYFTTSAKLIIIDAIDECGKVVNENAIIEIIRKRFHLFPSWIKLLVTSRKLETHAQLLMDFDVIYLPRSFRMQGGEVEIVSLFDEWGSSSCESALHAAIRGDHIDIMKSILSSDGGSTLTCLDRRGRTPLITAFQTDRSEIVKYIIEQHYNFVNRICGNATGINDKHQLNKREEVLLKGYECQSSLWLQKNIAGQNLRFDDNEEALEFFTEVTTGCLPAHFAACSGNIRFLQHQIRFLGGNYT
ncbi:hypothetical protein MAR_018711 [Mya arenaria]|uniref:Nephrocystin 3-like N-terminal domain-containing protein n=1 Tax=Mya arenaria TaxID=6604 RepID=A0ABY7EJC3_MYAAR|nr:hypothetical protein MAR_018711 [Mya arenaria]